MTFIEHREEKEMKKLFENKENGAPDRRDFLKTLGIGAVGSTLVSGNFFGETANAQTTKNTAKNADLIMKKIPRTGESVPAIGLGSFMTFDVLPGQPREFVGEVIKRFYDGGGRVIDTSPLYGTGETSVGAAINALGIAKDLFITNKIWSTGEFLADDSFAQKSLEQSQGRLWRDQFDAMQVHSLVNVDAVVPILKNWKRQNLIRYIGVTHHEMPYFPALAAWVEKGEVDFVQVRYSIAGRAAEERILPAALDKGVAVLVNMPLEKARLHKLVENRPLPDFAKDFGAENWSQFFLKWVISHPAVTCAIPATSNPAHQTENIGALKGELPDKAMRERMVKYMETVPGFDKLEPTAWYPGKNYNGAIRRAQMKNQPK
jgi:diketogulonate reductase-like aldo/keto reductase